MIGKQCMLASITRPVLIKSTEYENSFDRRRPGDTGVERGGAKNRRTEFCIGTLRISRFSKCPYSVSAQESFRATAAAQEGNYQRRRAKEVAAGANDRGPRRLPGTHAAGSPGGGRDPTGRLRHREKHL